MKRIFLYSSAFMLFYSCSQKASTSDDSNEIVDSVDNERGHAKQLFAVIEMEDTIHFGDSLILTFTVHNTSDSAQKFCKWHTPFEPLMSTYLQITDEEGIEVNYIGAMAKRAMPPSAESYITLAANNSLASTVDLLKGYELSKKGKYTVKYTGENMSGLSVKDSISFLYE